jgi:hypothetical protein
VQSDDRSLQLSFARASPTIGVRSDAEEVAENRHVPSYGLIRWFHGLAAVVNPSSGCVAFQAMRIVVFIFGHRSTRYM